ncbi:ABC transporter ATP-binding protein [Streptococcus sp. SGI.013]|uniref:ABC-2 type transport system ATP-binding protein n=1 Tax=Streptococcus porcorum TaxID=701526 RepID=A0ABV2JES4_9STRE
MTRGKDILQLNGLEKSYGSKLVLKNINFTIEAGKIVGLLGPNGSGKTTIIKAINGLLQLDKGMILVDEKSPSKETKAIVSYLPDVSYLNDTMRIADVLSLFQDFYQDFDRDKAERLLSDLGLNDSDRLKHLSKGNKEKVQLVLVMSRKAKLYILDEPIGGVDPAARDYILKTIITNYSEDASVLISTHLISEVESILDDVIFIKDGEVLLQGDADDLRTKYEQSIDSLFREQFRAQGGE